MVGRNKRFKLADTAQQVVGGFLVAGPFVVTEEVWVLATQMTLGHAAATIAIVMLIGYGALYKADHERDPDREVEVAGIPLRFVSLVLVSYLSVLILALAFSAPSTFLADFSFEERAITTLKAISVGSIFSVIGAATADTVF